MLPLIIGMIVIFCYIDGLGKKSDLYDFSVLWWIITFSISLGLLFVILTYFIFLNKKYTRTIGNYLFVNIFTFFYFSLLILYIVHVSILFSKTRNDIALLSGAMFMILPLIVCSFWVFGIFYVTHTIYKNKNFEKLKNDDWMFSYFSFKDDYYIINRKGDIWEPGDLVSKKLNIKYIGTGIYKVGKKLYAKNLFKYKGKVYGIDFWTKRPFILTNDLKWELNQMIKKLFAKNLDL